MKSTLFSPEHQEIQSDSFLALQNDYMLRAHLTAGRELVAQKGAMVAYQGKLDFAHRGSKSVGEFLKKAASSDDIPLMRIRGEGDVFISRAATRIHLLELENEGIVVNGLNALAFDASLDYDMKRNSLTGMLTGGVWNTHLKGSGTVALTSYGAPVILQTDTPTFTDLGATIAWSSNLSPKIKSTVKLGELIGRGSGESFQYSFSGPGWVIVQPAEVA